MNRLEKIKKITYLSGPLANEFFGYELEELTEEELRTALRYSKSLIMNLQKNVRRLERLNLETVPAL